MSDEFHCPHMETCPNVLQACERKVAAETALNVAKAEYDGKRKLMNELYAAGVAMRKVQNAIFLMEVGDAESWMGLPFLGGPRQ